MTTIMMNQVKPPIRKNMIELPKQLFGGESFPIEKLLTEEKYSHIEPIGQSFDDTKELMNNLRQLSVHGSFLDLPIILMVKLENYAWTTAPHETDTKFLYHESIISIVKACLLYLLEKTKEKTWCTIDKQVAIYETIVLFLYYNLYYRQEYIGVYGKISIKDMYIQFAKIAKCPRVDFTSTARDPTFFQLAWKPYLKKHFLDLEEFYQEQDVDHFCIVIQKSRSVGLGRLSTDLYRYIASFLCGDACHLLYDRDFSTVDTDGL
jgi:hypothetical protein